MRVKSEEKRLEILAIATEVFREKGYADASMNEIASRVGGSKSTLYNYFPSKEDLFVATMMELARLTSNPLLEELERATDVEQGLRHFVFGTMALLCTPEAIDFRRMVISEAGHLNLSKLIYEPGTNQHRKRYSEFFKSKIQEGFFCEADPWQAAIHLNSLCFGSPVQEVLEGVIENISEQEIKKAADEAVDFYLKAYRESR